MTVAEYLAFENSSPMRHEFVAGRVYEMTGTTARHNRIVSNIQARLRAATSKGSCAAYFIDLKIRAARNRIYYPDAVVVCTPHDGDALLFETPCLIVEVTSPATRRIDRGEKLDAYLGIPSLRGYAIAEQSRRHVTLYSRGKNGDWLRDEAIGSGTLVLPCVDTPIALDHVYEGVELPPLSVREDAGDEDAWIDEDELELR